MSGTTNLPAVFELWSAGPVGAAAETTSFATSEAAAEPAVRWQLDLPRDPAAARAQLSDREAQLAASHQALDAMPDRFEALVRQARAQGTVSFAAQPDEQLLERPEAEALRLLGLAEQGATGVSFGLGEDVRGDWQQASAQFQALTAQMSQLLFNLAWVETRREGQLLAQTVVGWTGDLNTAWGAAAGAETRALHRRSLALALAARLAWVRLFVVTTQGAARLAVLLSTPGGAVLALPAAWTFVNRVLADLSQYRKQVNAAEARG